MGKYNEYGTDFKLHPKRKERYIVNPYQMVASNGRYYLIANYDRYDDISHYRIDKITDVQILEEKVKSELLIPELKNGFNLPKHMAEHIYMFSGASERIKLRVDKILMTELVDWFGKDFRIIEETQDKMLIHAKCNTSAMKYWALQYGPNVEVLEPLALRDELRKEIQLMYKKYDK